MTAALSPLFVEDSVIDSLPPIGLDDLESEAELSERRDRKYLVDPHDLGRIVSGAGSGLRVLDIESARCFRYESIYFDTPELACYMAAAHRRPRRFKVRVRSYLDSELCRLEVKARRRDGQTSKQRSTLAFADRESLDSAARNFLIRAGVTLDPLELQPVSKVRYNRTTLLDTESNSRITIDTDLSAVVPTGEAVRAHGFVVVETKSIGHATAFDHSLWARGYRPTSMSKYCTLLAALYPSLPANHWNRTLRHHFDWVRQD